MDYDLNALAGSYNIDNVYDQYKRLEFLEKLSNYIDLKESTVLEFGSAAGQMTEILSKRAKKVVAVDGSSEFIRIAREKVNNVQFYEAYFEDFAIDERFDCLIMHHVLEHVKDPISLLFNVSKFLNEDGIIAISVPNRDALSRQLAVKMGLLSSVRELTENDINHGHQRTYSWWRLKDEARASGYNIIGQHGLYMKLFCDSQNLEMINAGIIGEEQIHGLWKLADEYWKCAGAIMIIIKR